MRSEDIFELFMLSEANCPEILTTVLSQERIGAYLSMALQLRMGGCPEDQRKMYCSLRLSLSRQSQ